MTPPVYGLLSYPGIGNLGDIIQARAARRFLPRVDCLIERERLATKQVSGPAKLIMNGWFMHNVTQWPPHSLIEPLLVSFHLAEPSRWRLKRLFSDGRKQMLSASGAEFLREHGPVGARDKVTLEALLRHGIPAYHSGCLTLTMTCTKSKVRTDHIVACDLAPAELAALRKFAGGREVVTVTHTGGELLDQSGQEQAAERLMDIYATAAAVVTSRIHAAQPCLAIGTPVLLVYPSRVTRRVTDVAELVHHCRSSDFIAGAFDFDFASPPSNPDRHLVLAKDLVARCKAFTGYDRQAGQSIADAAGPPD